MTRDIRDVLRGAAPAPSGPPDVEWIRSRGRRLAVTRVATLASVVVLAIAGVAGVVLSVVDTVDDGPSPMIVDPPSPAHTPSPSPVPAETPDDGEPPSASCGELDHHPEVVEGQQVAVYFYCAETITGLVGTPRDVPQGTDPIEAALEELVAGPTPDEEEQGFTSTLGSMDVDLLDAALVDEGGTAVIDLAGLPEELTPQQASFVAPGFMEEIAWTVFNLDDDIDAIELRLDGSCDAFWDRLTGEDCRTYTRDQWGHVEEE